MTPGEIGLRAAFVVLAVLGEVRAQQIFGDGFEESCFVDTDNDRLSNCEEVSRSLSYTNPDTDGDGLKDGDEVLGTTAGLNLPAMGVSPRHKDLLVEIDWTDDAFECAAHTHRPPAEVVEEVRIFYSLLPLANPDGTPGVNYIADYGQGGVFTGGAMVATGDGVVSFDELSTTYWPVEFAVNRRGYFRYSMHAHRWAYGEGSSGLGLGDLNLVTLYCHWDVDDYIRNTMIHELGHNLGLRHGGNEFCNSKPNYNSLMNYNHQFPGLDMDCDSKGDGIDFIGYSNGNRPPLDENALLEVNGVCGAAHPNVKPIDWNKNNVIDQVPVSAQVACEENNDIGIVSDWNDFAGIDLTPDFPQDGGAPVPDPQTPDACSPPPNF